MSPRRERYCYPSRWPIFWKAAELSLANSISQNAFLIETRGCSYILSGDRNCNVTQAYLPSDTVGLRSAIKQAGSVPLDDVFHSLNSRQRRPREDISRAVAHEIASFRDARPSTMLCLANYSNTQRALSDLEAAGIPHSDITNVANNAKGWLSAK